MSEPLSDRVAALTFKARALAQAHPLSPMASEYRQRKADEERNSQPLKEFADWASTAFLVGYCIRRVEEADVDQMPRFADSVGSDSGPDLTNLGSLAGEFANELRAGRPAGNELLDAELVEALLNKVISTEIDKRAEHWKAQITTQDWAQFEEYITWWVMHGYSFRAAETLRAEA